MKGSWKNLPSIVPFSDHPLPTPHPGTALPETQGDRRQRLLVALMESVFDGVLIVSRAGTMIYHNQLFLDIWNFPREIIGSRSDEAALEWAAHQTTDPAAFLAASRPSTSIPAAGCARRSP